MRKLLASAILAVCSLYAGDLGACGSGGWFGIRLTLPVTARDRREPPRSALREATRKKPAAPAKPTKPAAPAKPTGAGSAEADGHTVYELSDSILSAGGFGPCDATIRLRPRPVRSTVVPPRLSFIGELLRDIESL